MALPGGQNLRCASSSYQVVALSKDEFLSQHLSALVPSVVRGYCHTESSVRKTSVFCLVAIHAVVGEKIREYLSKLTSSQVACDVM